MVAGRGGRELTLRAEAREGLKVYIGDASCFECAPGLSFAKPSDGSEEHDRAQGAAPTNSDHDLGNRIRAGSPSPAVARNGTSFVRLGMTPPSKIKRQLVPIIRISPKAGRRPRPEARAIIVRQIVPDMMFRASSNGKLPCLMALLLTLPFSAMPLYEGVY